MPTFTIRYTQTMVTTEEVIIEADTAEEAIERVRSYDFDNSYADEVDQQECTYSNVELKDE